MLAKGAVLRGMRGDDVGPGDESIGDGRTTALSGTPEYGQELSGNFDTAKRGSPLSTGDDATMVFKEVPVAVATESM